MDGNSDAVVHLKEPESVELNCEETLKQQSQNSQSTENNATDHITTDTNLSQSNEECSSSSDSSPNLIESDNSSSEGMENDTVGNPILDCDLVNDLNLLREQNKMLQTNVIKLEKENARLEADRSPELHALQIDTLEKTIFQLKQEIQRLQDSSKQQTEIFETHIGQMKQDYESKLERLSKQTELANKERESMVMKYAVSEKTVIDLKREIQSYENKTKEAVKEKESSLAKLKMAMTEKSKINQLLDAKHSEITALERENTKRKDEIQLRDSQVKWAKNRLKVEMDNHAETQGKLEKLQQKFNEAREETEQYKKKTLALIKSYQEAQEDKANQEQEQRAKLIIDKHDEETVAKLQLELENNKKKQKRLIEENNQLSLKIQNLEKERLEYEQNLSKMKQNVDSEKQTVVDLQAQLTELESTKLLLQHEQERLAACQNEVERIRLSNAELQEEMKSCRSREAELLEFTQKLTEKNVRLQSEFSAVEARAQQLEVECDSYTRQISQLNIENSSLKEELEKEKKQREEEKQLLSTHLAEKTKKTEELAQSLADQQGENQLLKKKHLVTLKELTKELQVSRKKLEMYEKHQLANQSRSSSSTSLNIVDTSENHIPSSQPTVTTVPSIPTEPDRQVLIDKIVKIQRLNAKKTEKIEFLEEHVKQLVSELQKKTRIIQNYIIREQSGALSSETMDHNKVALSKHGGIMASVYNSKPVDDGMTLELSLEINQKLQAVLEDTLLKNITLKENMETLGNEIARLTTSQKS